MSTYRLKGASGAVVNQTFMLGDRTVIGSAEDCELQVDAEGVRPHHAEIAAGEAGGLLLRSLDPAADTLLNGEPVDTAPLASGDEIRVAGCRWVLQAPGLRPEKMLTEAATRPRRAWLPWAIAAALLAAAAVAWQQGLLPF